MPDIQINDSCDKIGEDMINYYLCKYNNFYLYFSGTYCHNCKSIESMLNSNNDINYLKILIDDNDTDEYMDYLEGQIGNIKIPTLLKVDENKNISDKFIGEECCKKELYSIDSCDDF